MGRAQTERMPAMPYTIVRARRRPAPCAGRLTQGRCPAVTGGATAGGVHRTYLCLTCQLEMYDPPLNEETCVVGVVRMMAPDHGLTPIEHTQLPDRPWWPELPNPEQPGSSPPTELR